VRSPKVLHYFNDPGHGWLRVAVKFIEEIGLKDISSCSYISSSGEWVYLEEDCDADNFFIQLEKLGIPRPAVKSHHTNRRSRIRSYDCWSPQQEGDGEKESMKKHVFTIKGGSLGRRLVADLVDRSAWFELTPVPNDCFELTVKSEHEDFVRKALWSMLNGKNKTPGLLAMVKKLKDMADPATILWFIKALQETLPAEIKHPQMPEAEYQGEPYHNFSAVCPSCKRMSLFSIWQTEPKPCRCGHSPWGRKEAA